ncbi:hypothetical protein [Dongia sp.]|uniref:hypothetical protein n=1 Tax=Dongia sp. TaxID=1977262 RepID=UPI0035B4E84B
MAPFNPRPRPYAERPSGPLASKPANDNVLGAWENGVFRFASPEAKEKWRWKSYEQGVGEETWHLGKEIDSKSAAITQAGLGGANPGLFLGPDGKYRLMNAKTIESQEARDHRNKYLTGKTMDQIAAAKAMPGVEEWVAKGKAEQGAANDDAADAAVALNAQRPASSSTDETKPPSAKPLPRPDQGAGQMMAGRFGAMKSALESADMQSADDIGRIAVNSVLGNYGDEVRAGMGAIGSWWDGKAFGDAFDSQLQAERAKTEAAQERQGLTGTGVELLTSFIPIVGDLSGAAADFKDWKEHGDEWGAQDYIYATLGVAPGMPNRKAIKSAEKIGGKLADKVVSAWEGEGEELLGAAGTARKSGIDNAPADGTIKNVEQVTFDPQSFFPKDENDILTKKEVLNLSGENSGLYWVAEPETHMPHAAAYERGGKGYVWSKKHNMPAKPSLRWDNPDGDNLVRFDHLDPTPEATYLVLVDSKTDVPPSFPGAQHTAAADLRRQISAVRQNNKVINGPKYKIRYELPDQSRAEAMSKLLRSLGYEDEVTVLVREASEEAQNKFKKLRKKG